MEEGAEANLSDQTPLLQAQPTEITEGCTEANLSDHTPLLQVQPTDIAEGCTEANLSDHTPLLQAQPTGITEIAAEANLSDQTPLLQTQPTESTFQRTGTLWTALAHLITGVIGAGVLSLAWSMAQLGWIAGPIAMLLFAFVISISTFLLCDCYRSPDPELGPRRNRNYLEAVDSILGKTAASICSVFVHLGLFGQGIAYTVTSATSTRAIRQSNCYHKEGHGAACEFGDTYYMLFFGVAQIFLSQIPHFHNIKWLSFVAAVMSFTYSFIGLGLGVAKVIGNGYLKGSIGGVSTSTATEKVLLVAQALGDIAFAYPYALILIEIQDTLKSPPPENETMKKGSKIAIFVSTFFYLLCGGFGYAAFGDDTPGDLLTGFGFYEPYWLIDFANACIVLHLVGGYQVYSQPLFANFEKRINEMFPNNRLANNDFDINLPLLPAFQLNLLRLCFRSIYVALTTVIAMLVPFFNLVLGVLGGLCFWTLSICFPVEMYFKQRNIEPWTVKWAVLRTFSIVCLMVNIFAFFGSSVGLVTAKFS